MHEENNHAKDINSKISESLCFPMVSKRMFGIFSELNSVATLKIQTTAKNG